MRRSVDQADADEPPNAPAGSVQTAVGAYLRGEGQHWVEAFAVGALVEHMLHGPPNNSCSLDTARTVMHLNWDKHLPFARRQLSRKEQAIVDRLSDRGERVVERCPFFHVPRTHSWPWSASLLHGRLRSMVDIDAGTVSQAASHAAPVAGDTTTQGSVGPGSTAPQGSAGQGTAAPRGAVGGGSTAVQSTQARSSTAVQDRSVGNGRPPVSTTTSTGLQTPSGTASTARHRNSQGVLHAGATPSSNELVALEACGSADAGDAGAGAGSAGAAAEGAARAGTGGAGLQPQGLSVSSEDGWRKAGAVDAEALRRGIEEGSWQELWQGGRGALAVPLLKEMAHCMAKCAVSRTRKRACGGCHLPSYSILENHADNLTRVHQRKLEQQGHNLSRKDVLEIEEASAIFVRGNCKGSGASHTRFVRLNTDLLQAQGRPVAAAPARKPDSTVSTAAAATAAAPPGGMVLAAAAGLQLLASAGNKGAGAAAAAGAAGAAGAAQQVAAGVVQGDGSSAEQQAAADDQTLLMRGIEEGAWQQARQGSLRWGELVMPMLKALGRQMAKYRMARPHSSKKGDTIPPFSMLQLDADHLIAERIKKLNNIGCTLTAKDIAGGFAATGIFVRGDCSSSGKALLRLDTDLLQAQGRAAAAAAAVAPAAARGTTTAAAAAAKPRGSLAAAAVGSGQRVDAVLKRGIEEGSWQTQWQGGRGALAVPLLKEMAHCMAGYSTARSVKGAAGSQRLPPYSILEDHAGNLAAKHFKQLKKEGRQFSQQDLDDVLAVSDIFVRGITQPNSGPSASSEGGKRCLSLNTDVLMAQGRAAAATAEGVAATTAAVDATAAAPAAAALATVQPGAAGADAGGSMEGLSDWETMNRMAAAAAASQAKASEGLETASGGAAPGSGTGVAQGFGGYAAGPWAAYFSYSGYPQMAQQEAVSHVQAPAAVGAAAGAGGAGAAAVAAAAAAGAGALQTTGLMPFAEVSVRPVSTTCNKAAAAGQDGQSGKRKRAGSPVAPRKVNCQPGAQ